MLSSTHSLLGPNGLTTSRRCVRAGPGLTSGVLDKPRAPAFVCCYTEDI